MGSAVPFFDVVQECTGAMGSLELASGFLDSPDDCVLVTTGDRFDDPWVCRWYGDQSVLADGGSAVVFGTGGGIARILSMVTSADNGVEGEARGAKSHSGADLDVIERFSARTLLVTEDLGEPETSAPVDSVRATCDDGDVVRLEDSPMVSPPSRYRPTVTTLLTLSSRLVPPEPQRGFLSVAPVWGLTSGVVGFSAIDYMYPVSGNPIPSTQIEVQPRTGGMLWLYTTTDDGLGGLCQRGSVVKRSRSASSFWPYRWRCGHYLTFGRASVAPLIRRPDSGYCLHPSSLFRSR